METIKVILDYNNINIVATIDDSPVGKIVMTNKDFSNQFIKDINDTLIYHGLEKDSFICKYECTLNMLKYLVSQKV